MVEKREALEVLARELMDGAAHSKVVSTQTPATL
jgi:hypothetical protein